ncbi:MAG: hypothetical protein Q4G33_03945 [bacterium]|nr:hypothetical protein [bacterium]
MIDYEKIRNTVVDLLKQYTGVEVVLANQAAHIPERPYISFTITSPMIANNGTYGRYSDGFDRKPVKQIWSITSHTETTDEAAVIAQKAFDFFERFYEVLAEHEIVVVRLGNITNRDTFLTVDYEYRCGFDVTFGLMNETARLELDEGEIETALVNSIRIERKG